MRISQFCRAIGLFVFLFVGNAAHGFAVGISAFTSAAKVEGFEGLTAAGTNLAIQTPYSFPSGVVMTGPVPSVSGTFGPYIVSDGFYGLYAGQYVPDGKAYLGQANPDDLTGPLVFTFPSPMLRVGAYFSTTDPPYDPTATVTMEVFDAKGNLLESTAITGISPAQWASDFVGLQDSAGISTLELVGDRSGVLRMDDLTFEVPEPSVVSILLIGTGFGARRPRK